MTDILIEPIGNGEYDLALVDNDLVLVGGTEETWPAEVAQRVTYAVCTWYGESAFDRDAGFPWREGVFGRQPIDGIAALVHEHILAVEGVQGIGSQPVLTLDTTTRKLSILATEVEIEGFAPLELGFTIQGTTA